MAKLAKYLCLHGHDVLIVTSFVSAGQTQDESLLSDIPSDATVLRYQSSSILLRLLGTNEYGNGFVARATRKVLRPIVAARVLPDLEILWTKDAKEKIALIKKRIEDKEITFAEAARTMSDEKETRANGGALINPKTQDTRFELTKMDPSLYSQVSNLKEGAISLPLMDQDQSGKKKFKLITVTNRINEHTADYAKDYTKIKELALKEKQIKAIGKWFDEKIKETYIKINGEYRDCAFTNNWVKK